MELPNLIRTGEKPEADEGADTPSEAEEPTSCQYDWNSVHLCVDPCGNSCWIDYGLDTHIIRPRTTRKILLLLVKP